MNKKIFKIEDTKTLLGEMVRIIDSTTTEDDITHVVKAITILRDYAEHKRREIIQIRLNKENLNRSCKYTHQCRDLVIKWINSNK